LSNLSPDLPFAVLIVIPRTFENFAFLNMSDVSVAIRFGNRLTLLPYGNDYFRSLGSENERLHHCTLEMCDDEECWWHEKGTDRLDDS
jgi:hypothetical protein